MKFEGEGILSGDIDFEELDKKIEEGRRKEQEAVHREADRDTTTALIEHALMPTVREELAEEMAEKKLASETLSQYASDFQRFKRFCQSWDLPHLPASPQVTAAFLADECEQGFDHLSRLKAAIVAAHRAADLFDPTEDLLVRAVMRLARKSTPGGNTATTKDTD
jgi:hypothetical protein